MFFQFPHHARWESFTVESHGAITYVEGRITELAYHDEFTLFNCEVIKFASVRNPTLFETVDNALDIPKTPKKGGYNWEGMSKGVYLLRHNLLTITNLIASYFSDRCGCIFVVVAIEVAI